MSFSLKTHEFVARAGVSVLDRVNPYIRLSEGHTPPIFAQAGRFFYEGGQVIEEAELPEWFTTQWASVNPEVKEEAGFEAKPKQERRRAS